MPGQGSNKNISENLIKKTFSVQAKGFFCRPKRRRLEGMEFGSNKEKGQCLFSSGDLEFGKEETLILTGTLSLDFVDCYLEVFLPMSDPSGAVFSSAKMRWI